MKSSLARTIENNADHISYDALCKQLLSEKSILAWIMKYCVSECQEMAVEDIIRCIEASPSVSAAPVFPDEKNTTLINGMNTVNTSHDEGTVAFDILFAAMIPSSKPMRLIINVEVQMDFNSHYPQTSRAEYYSAWLISSQKDREFTDSHYGDIKKVYSIWVCTNPPKYRENTIYITSVMMKERSGRMGRPIKGYGLQRTAFIMLGNEEKKGAEGVLRLLDVLFRSDKDVEERKRILEEEFHIAMNEDMEMEVRQMCNLSKGVENRGIRKGIVQGREEEKLNLIRRLMKKLNLTLEQAMDVLDVPKSEQENMCICLERINDRCRVTQIEEGDDMGAFSRVVWMRGFRKGYLQGLEETCRERIICHGTDEEKCLLIKNVMEMLHYTVEESMDALGVSKDEWEKYKKMLE